MWFGCVWAKKVCDILIKTDNPLDFYLNIQYNIRVVMERTGR